MKTKLSEFAKLEAKLWRNIDDDSDEYSEMFDNLEGTMQCLKRKIEIINDQYAKLVNCQIAEEVPQ